MNLRKVTGEDGACKGYRAFMLRSQAVRLGLVHFPKPFRNDGILVLTPEIEEWRSRNRLAFDVNADDGFVVSFHFPDWHTAFAFKMAWT